MRLRTYLPTFSRARAPTISWSMHHTWRSTMRRSGIYWQDQIRGFAWSSGSPQKLASMWKTLHLSLCRVLQISADFLWFSFDSPCLCAVSFSMLKCRVCAGKPFWFFFCQSSYQCSISHDNTNAPVWFLQVGKKSRSVAATLMNQDSSRSHSIFTITVETSARESTLPDGSMHIRVGKLNLVQHPCLRMFPSACLEGTKVKWQLVVCWFVYVFTMILWNMSDALVVFLQIVLEKIWCSGARLQCSRETLQPSHKDF